MKQHIIALADCDSFYVSCERKDDRRLEGRPVCVMTGAGNKGIVVSRSKEAKALGIAMGAPYFQVKDLGAQVAFIPARMQRYAEISRQVMEIVKTFSPEVEVCSIDEAYLDLTGLDKVYKCDWPQLAENIRQSVWKKAHIPVSVGLGSSKILAKLASDKAKNNAGVFVIWPDKIMDIIGDTPIEEVSGIGRHNLRRLQMLGVFTVRQLTAQDNAWVRKVLGINGLCLKHELLGTLTSPVNSLPAAAQSIQDSRSFEDFTDSLEFLRRALQTHVHEACQKLRQNKGFCGGLEVMLKTRDFKVMAVATRFARATNSDFEIGEAAQQLLTMLYKPKILYRSTGATLKRLTYGVEQQATLFDDWKPVNDCLSTTIDKLEAKYGRGIVCAGTSAPNRH